MSCTRERCDSFRTSKIEGSILRDCDDWTKEQSDDASYTITRLHLGRASTRYSRSAVRNTRVGIA